MTGFGRYEYADKERKLVIEMKAVNHRYSDITIKIPKKLSFFEAAMRNHLKKYIDRGKVDVFVTYEDYTESNVCVKYNEIIASEYMGYLDEMATRFNLINDIKPATLARFPEVFTLEEQTIDEEKLWKLIEEVLDKAIEAFVESRIIEGENLKTDMLSKLDDMISYVDYIEDRSPELVKEYRDKLEAKVRDLLEGASLDDSRIATEVTIYADKICVDEETVRLRSHIESTKAILNKGGSVGRKLDFIAQEMNREANTILSKANSLDISNKAIDLKTEIEKVREQIQNIE